MARGKVRGSCPNINSMPETGRRYGGRQGGGSRKQFCSARSNQKENG